AHHHRPERHRSRCGRWILGRASARDRASHRSAAPRLTEPSPRRLLTTMNARLLIPLVFLTITSGVETSAAQVTGPALRQALDALGEGGHRVLSQWSGSVPRFTATTTSAEEARTN